MVKEIIGNNDEMFGYLVHRYKDLVNVKIIDELQDQGLSTDTIENIRFSLLSKHLQLVVENALKTAWHREGQGAERRGGAIY